MSDTTRADRAVAALTARVDELEARYARSALGAYEHEERIDCTCTQNLGMRDSRTGSVRLGYSSIYVYLPPGQPFAVTCKRCKAVVLVGERGEVTGTLDPAAAVRGWRPGDPLPDGVLPL